MFAVVFGFMACQKMAQCLGFKMRQTIPFEDHFDKLFNNMERFKELTCITAGAVVLIYTTLAVKLTLKWNYVTDVYTVASTGQIIPLVGSLLLVVYAVWESRIFRSPEGPLLPTSDTPQKTTSSEIQDQAQFQAQMHPGAANDSTTCASQIHGFVSSVGWHPCQQYTSIETSTV